MLNTGIDIFCSLAGLDLAGLDSASLDSATLDSLGLDLVGLNSAGLGFDIYHKNSVAYPNTSKIFFHGQKHESISNNVSISTSSN